MNAVVFLKPGREKSLRNRHPWVFSGAVARVEGSPEMGETVEVRSQDGAFRGRGAWSPDSQIVVRVWTFDPEEPIDADFFRERLRRAIEARRLMGAGWTEAGPVSPSAARAAAALTGGAVAGGPTQSANVAAAADAEKAFAAGGASPGRPRPAVSSNACRLVNAESDGVPGLIADRYGDWLVCQLLSAGAERWRRTLVDLLGELLPVAGVYERSDASVREKEGLPSRTGVLAGDEPPERVEIVEGPCRFLVDVRGGHKTGFYLDQRDNRAVVAAYASGAELLNAFSYTGGFGVRALQAGAARVTNVDTSSELLALGQENFERNRLDTSRVDNIEGDVFEVQRRFRDARREFDAIVLDPPKFAESRAQVPQASRGYKDINLMAMRLVRPGGVLFTFSCSGHVGIELFQKIVADAALDSGRQVQVIGRLGQPADHPVALSFPQGAYLKGLACRIW